MAVLTALALAFLLTPQPSVTTVPYSEIKELIRSGQVGEAILEEHSITVNTGDSPDTADLYRAVTPAQGDDELLRLLEDSGVEITAKEPIFRANRKLMEFLPEIRSKG